MLTSASVVSEGTSPVEGLTGVPVSTVTGLAGAVGLPTGLVTVGVLVAAAVILCTQVWNYTTHRYITA